MFCGLANQMFLIAHPLHDIKWHIHNNNEIFWSSKKVYTGSPLGYTLLWNLHIWTLSIATKSMNVCQNSLSSMLHRNINSMLMYVITFSVCSQKWRIQIIEKHIKYCIESVYCTLKRNLCFKFLYSVIAYMGR